MTRWAALFLVAMGCSDKSGPRSTSAPAPTPSAVMVSDAATASSDDATIADARALVGNLAATKFGDVVKTFDATMAGALPEARLSATWNSLVGQAGAFEAIEATRVQHVKGHVVVIVTCKFKLAKLDATVAYDEAGKVAGLHFTPAAVAYTDPPYVDRAKIVERDVTVGTGEWALPGTLTLPAGPGPFRAVVLVHGSGPNDRDESVGANKPFKDLAGGLASKGIAVLRYEKRTKVYGAKMVAQGDVTIDQESVDDAVLAVELLRGMKEIDRRYVVVAGHSLGGYVAPRIGIRAKDIAGLAILAGSTRGDIAAVMIEQMKYIASVDPRQATAMPAAIEEIEKAGKRVKELQNGAKPTPGENVLGAGAAYWIAIAKYDPIATIKQFKKPIFVEQGGRDYQVTQLDYDAWQKGLAGRKDVTFKLYPELNHMFAAGTGKSSPAEYEQRTPVDARLVDDLATWVKAL